MPGILNPLEGIVYTAPERAKYYFERGAWIDRTIGDQLRYITAQHPDRVAFICEGRTVSFREVDEWSDQLGALLVERGLKVNDRAMFQMGTVIESAVALFACLKAGVLPVCTIPQYREIEIGKLAAVTRPRGYFVQADVDPKFDIVSFARKMAAECGMPHLLVARSGQADDPWLAARSIPLQDARRSLARVHLGSEDVAVMQLSGGSTGVPKVIPRHHAEYLGHAFHWCEKLDMREDDIGLWALPILHNAGMLWAFLRTILYGSTAVLMPRFEVRKFFELIEAHAVTHCFTIGPLVRQNDSQWAHIVRCRVVQQHLRLPGRGEIRYRERAFLLHLARGRADRGAHRVPVGEHVRYHRRSAAAGSAERAGRAAPPYRRHRQRALGRASPEAARGCR